jgi:predicted O-methyltransferase YrrM
MYTLELAEYDDIEWVEEDSSDAAKQSTEQLDFVYLDADVKYEYIERDIELYYELLVTDGITAGRDFNGGSLNVIRAVEKFTQQNDLRFGVDIPDWYIRTEQRVGDSQ